MENQKFNDIYIFNLGSNNLIKIKPADPNEEFEDLCCYQAITTGVLNKTNYVLAEDDLLSTIEDMLTLLSKAYNQKLIIHNSIKNNLGYLWNIQLFINDDFFTENFPTYVKDVLKKYCFVKEKSENKTTDWVGEKNLLWSYTHLKQSLWIYNNNDDEIILELNPEFDWDQFGNHENTEIYEQMLYDQRLEIKQKFKEFLDNYKPLEQVTISKYNTKLLINQLEEIKKDIEKRNKAFFSTQLHTDN